MTDEQLIARLRKADEYEPLGHDGWEAADRIELLEYMNNTILGAVEQRDATIEALEAKLKTSEEIGCAFEEDAGQLREKLAKTAAFLEEIAITGDWFISDMNDLIKELKGDSHE